MLKNNNVFVQYHENDKYIFFKDLTDVYNETSGYTQKKRGVAKAWEFLNILFNKYELKEDIDFNDIKNILDSKERFNLNVRTYCAMD